MKITTLKQGSPDWHQFRSCHFGASEAPSMLGESKFKSRNQLLHEKATGIVPDVDAATQRRFDDGHRAEELARGLAEAMINDDLYPATGEEGKLSASFDGLTLDQSTAWEHKLLNDTLRACETAADLPICYRIQMEQCLMLSGAERCLFSATKWDDAGNLLEEKHIWYTPDHDLRSRILQGWTQFAIDLENYQHIEHIEKPKAEVCIELPALFVHARGEITTHNMQEFGEALQAKLEEVRAIALVTDQDFSNAKAAAKMFRDKAKEIKVSKDSMLSQTVTIGEAARMMDAWSKDLNETALKLEKDVEREDLAKKRVMVGEAGIAFSAHIEALEAETRPIQLNVPRPDFAIAIKNKRTYTSMQGALDDALAQGRIDADAIAKDVRAKLAWCKEHAAGMSFLFPDLQQIIIKPLDDFTLTITSRIKEHKEAEARKEAEIRAKAEADAAAKLESDRAAMQAEEEAKAKAAQDALLAAERAKMEAEVKAAHDAEIKEEIATLQKYEKVENLGEEPISTIEERRKQAQLDAQAQPFKLSGAKTIVAQAIALHRPNRAELLDAIATTFGTTNEAALDWILQEFRGDIQHEARKAA